MTRPYENGIMQPFLKGMDTIVFTPPTTGMSTILFRLE